MSTSYPYLTLSRRLGVRYGDVLKVVDYLDFTFGRNWKEGFVPVPEVANTVLPKEDVQMVYIIWANEQERRGRVLSES